jgi:glycosyltransferase involved in cell wall biosynthesis
MLGPTYPFRGGIAHYTTLLYLELKKKHEVRLISFAHLYPSLLFPGRSQVDESRQYFEIENQPLLDPFKPLSWYRTAQEIKRLDPDLLLIQWWHPFFAIPLGMIAFWVRRSSGVRIYYLCHNVLPHEGTLFDRVLTRFAFRPASGFIAHSQQDENRVKEIRSSATVARIPHPTYESFRLDPALTMDEARRRLDVHGRMVLFFGFIRPYKGLIHLLRAMPQVLSVIHCTLYVVGEFYEKKDRYLQELKRLGIEKSVRIIDRYISNEEVPLYFSAADVVVLPYISATQSGVVQIAYAFEKPVITTNTGGLPEAVREGETGLLVPPEDPEALAEAIISFFKDNRGAEFSRNVSKYRSFFAWEKAREAIERLAAEPPTLHV